MTLRLPLPLTVRESPVRHAVVDQAHPVRWSPPPPAHWSGWEVRYDNDAERHKRSSRAFEKFPRNVARLLDTLTSDPVTAAIAEAFGFDFDHFSHDPTFHGGGLHVTGPGGHLNCHLDYDRHPTMDDCRRAVNLIAFLHDRWEPTWGGQFYLADPLGNPLVVIDPLPGRVIAFETTDLAYHGVLPVTGPADRVSLATYYLAPAGPQSTRLRALFLPSR